MIGVLRNDPYNVPTVQINKGSQYKQLLTTFGPSSSHAIHVAVCGNILVSSVQVPRQVPVTCTGRYHTTW